MLAIIGIISLHIYFIFLLMQALNLTDPSEHGFLPFSYAVNAPDWSAEEQIRMSDFEHVPLDLTSVDQSLKKKFRNGIPCPLRRKFWFLASGGYALMKEADVTYKQIEAVALKAGDPTPDDFFGVPPLFFSFLPNVFVDKLVSFLHIVRYQNKNIEFSPLIPSVSAVLLLMMEPSLAYFSIQAMINRSRKDEWYFKITKSSFQATIEATDILIDKKCHHLTEHAKSIGINIVEICLFLFPMFLLPILSTPVMLSLFDTFVFEGRKILVRFCVAIFELEEKELMETHTADEFISTLIDLLSKVETVKEMKILFNQSFKISLSRKRDILVLEKKYGTKDHLDFSQIDANKMNMMSHFPVPVDYDSSVSAIDKMMKLSLPKEVDFSKLQLLTVENYYLVRKFLPHEVKRFAPSLVFDMGTDGTVLSALIHEARYESFYILIIQTRNRLFGALFNGPLTPQADHSKYIGDQQTMMFDFTNRKAYKRYPITNKMFISVTNDLLIFGGPHFAIYLEDSMAKVGSQNCETFNSPSMVESETGDKVLELQLFRLLEK